MKYSAIAKPLYSKNKDNMHNWKHILRIEKKAKMLKKSFSDINEDKLDFIICFHGQKEWVMKNEKKLGVPSDYFSALYRHMKNPLTNEEKIVVDANNLENVGEFGIKKSFFVGKEIGRSYDETVNYIRKHIRDINFYTLIGKKHGQKGVEYIMKWLDKQKSYRPAVFIVTYRKEKQKILYLLLKRKLHWTGWEFPKGGVEEGESLIEAAKRECYEESGQKPVKTISLPYSGKYKYKPQLKDRPGMIGQSWKLFSCEVKNNNVKFDKKEHSGFKWLEFEDAKKLLTWPNQRKTLEIVDKMLKKKK